MVRILIRRESPLQRWQLTSANEQYSPHLTATIIICTELDTSSTTILHPPWEGVLLCWGIFSLSLAANFSYGSSVHLASCAHHTISWQGPSHFLANPSPSWYWFPASFKFTDLHTHWYNIIHTGFFSIDVLYQVFYFLFLFFWGCYYIFMLLYFYLLSLSNNVFLCHFYLAIIMVNKLLCIVSNQFNSRMRSKCTPRVHCTCALQLLHFFDCDTILAAIAGISCVHLVRP